MNRNFRRLERIEYLLSSLKTTLDVSKKSHYYVVNNKFSEKERDIRLMKHQIKRILKIKHCILESIQLDAEKTKANISFELRQLSINK